MSPLRMPQSLGHDHHVDTGEAVLRFELLEELDASLGRCERAVEASVAALAEFDAAVAAQRAPLLAAATQAVWRLIVQREACDLSDRERLVKHFHIPPDVMARLGGR
jgi:hypothetical protein